MTKAQLLIRLSVIPDDAEVLIQDRATGVTYKLEWVLYEQSHEDGEENIHDKVAIVG